MPRASKSARRRPAAAARSRRRAAPPPLASPFEPAPHAERIGRLMRRMMDQHVGSKAYKSDLKAVRDLTIRGVHDSIVADLPFARLWPAGLYIPAGANEKAHWGLSPCPADHRYTHDWTHSPIGWAAASRIDGSLFATASSPTVKGAIDGTSEAGVGFLFTPKATLARVRISPDLRFEGRHEWNVYIPPSPPVIVVKARLIGQLWVGAFELNLATHAFDDITNFTWTPHVVFNQPHAWTSGWNAGPDQSPLVTVPFNVSGAQAARDVVMQAGHTYLIAVVAQVGLRITTTHPEGVPWTVPDGKFQTWCSLGGIVREVWLSQTILVP